MKKGIILFDIDRTILNNAKLRDFIIEGVLDVIGKEKHDVFLKAWNKYVTSLSRDREFDPAGFAKTLASILKKDLSSQIEEAFYKENIFKDSLFSDTPVVLEQLSKKYDLGVFSEGTGKFQNFKYKHLGLDKYFDKKLVFIFPEKDTHEVLEEIPEGSIVVDDKQIIVEHLKEHGIKAVWVNRKTKEKIDGIPTIFSLKELLDLPLLKA